MMFRVSVSSGAISHMEGKGKKLFSACVVFVAEVTVIGTSVTVEYTQFPTVRVFDRKPYIAPDATAVDSETSEEVCTTTPTAPYVAVPIVNPASVRVTAEEAGIAAPEVVIITLEAVVKLQVPARLAMLLLPDVKVGFTPVAKKLEGYESVMEPPGLRRVVAVNPRVTETAVFVAIRSSEAIEKETLET